MSAGAGGGRQRGTLADRGSRGRRAGRGTGGALVVASAFFVVLLALVAADRLWWVVAAAYAVLSVVAFAAYALDKSAARRGSWRTAESTLHTLGLVGGWPGALVARHAFRHKTTKQPFRSVFWLTVAINCAALVAYVVAGPKFLR